MELRRYWEVLWRRKYLFLLISGGIVILTLAWALFASPVYMATTKVFIKIQDPPANLNSMTPSGLSRLDFTTSGNAAGTIMEMLNNHDALSDTINGLDLKRNGVHFSSVEFLNPGFFKIAFNQTGVRIEQVTNSDVINITGFSKYPALAVNISNAVTQNALKIIGNINRNAIEKTIVILTQETSRLKSLLVDSEETIKNYMVNHEAINLSDKISDYTTQLVTIKLSIAKMSVEKKEDHPDVEAALRQLTIIKNELKSIPVKQLELNNLQRINTAINSVYVTLLSDLEKAQILKALSITNMLVIEKAKIPDSTKKHYIFFPKKKLMLMLAMIIGSFSGIIVVFFAEYIDDTVKTPYELKIWTEQNVLTSIIALKDIDVFPPRDIPPILRSVNDLWLSIITIEPAFQKNKSLILTITSFGNNEGKSLVVAYLGYLLSQNEIKTLLVDFNLTNPFLSKLYQNANTQNIKTHETSHTVKMTDNIKKLNDCLYLLPTCRTNNPSASQRLNSSSYILAAMDRIKNQFDIILVDSSSLSNSKEPFFMASKSDATILVVEAGRYQIENIHWALHELSNFGAKIYGVVLNKQNNKYKNI